MEFTQNDYVVYPTHGVGKVEAIEKEIVAGMELEMFVIHFAKDKMTLRVPTSKAGSVGMRCLSSPAIVGKAMTTLKDERGSKERCGLGVPKSMSRKLILVI